MQLFKRFFNFYVNSSIHVSLAIVSLMVITLRTLYLSANFNELGFVFFASITGYNFVKYFGVVKFHHRSLAYSLKAIQVFSLLAFLMMIYFAFFLHLKTLVGVCFFALLTFLYAIPVSKKSLRNTQGLKVFVVALVWAGVTVLLPVFNATNKTVTNLVCLLTLQRIVFVLVLLIPFEIRDLKYDQNNLYTLPQRIGVKKTKMVGVLLLIVFFMLAVFQKSTWLFLSVQGVIAFVTGLFVLFSSENQGKYYSSFWVESIPIIWCLIVIFIT